VKTRKIIEVPGAFYFSSCRVCRGFQLFKNPDFVRLVLNTWAWLREHERIWLVAFVIMPTHVHYVFKPRGNYSAHTTAHNFGSYTGHEMLKLVRSKYPDILQLFASTARDWNDRDHVVWENVYVKTIDSVETLERTIEYVHNNPCAKNWHLCNDRADYPYSSACWYDRQEKPIIEVDDLELALTTECPSP
jgi:REP element-mobilizing transposase RayT